jgi:restriction system protein
MTSYREIPSAQDLMWPTLLALRSLGGSGRIEEINEEVVRQQGFTEEQLAVRRADNDRMPAIEYRLAWARSRLKNAGAIENSSRGVWALTDGGRDWTSAELDARWHDTKTEYGKEHRNRQSLDLDHDSRGDVPEIDENSGDWREKLLEKLLTMDPGAFERLAQRLLREAGFRNVEVVGKSGDGGIDGVGVYQLSLVSFPIYFQCKRYKGTVSPSAVRDFRGAMSGRGEKGLLITTGTFTRDARDEANRDGAPPVELINGENLCDLLKQYSLGVKTSVRTVEEITIEDDYFDQV